MIICENMADSLSMNIPCRLCFIQHFVHVGKRKKLLGERGAGR